MAATEFQIRRLQRMTDQVNEDVYTVDDLADFIEQYPLPDTDELEPDEDDWTPTYDLNAAAADVWEEIAGTQWDKFTFAAVGEATYQRSTKHDNAMQMVRYYRSRSVVKSVKVETDQPVNEIPAWIGNINDPHGDSV